MGEHLGLPRVVLRDPNLFEHWNGCLMGSDPGRATDTLGYPLQEPGIKIEGLDYQATTKRAKLGINLGFSPGLVLADLTPGSPDWPPLLVFPFH